MKTVYYDVGNTLEVPFITGIQRVTREVSKAVLAMRPDECRFSFKPIIFDTHRSQWRELTPKEHTALLSDTPRSLSLFARALHKARKYLPQDKSIFISEFEENSIFLDIDSSWHADLKRSELLPNLIRNNVRVAKLHYDIIPVLFPETTHPNTIKVFKEHLEAHLESSSLFLCISENSRRDLIDYCKNRSTPIPQTEVIRLGTESAISKRNRTLRPEANGLQKFGKFLLSVGTIEPRKNYAFLIKAFDLIASDSQLNLVIVGKKGWLADTFCTELESHPQFGQRIFHISNADDKLLDDLYSQAWLTVVPSLYEGYGLPVVESLARGCPTISSRAGSLGEVGGEFVRYFSPDALGELTSLITELEANINAYRVLELKAESYRETSWAETANDIIEHLSR